MVRRGAGALVACLVAASAILGVPVASPSPGSTAQASSTFGDPHFRESPVFTTVDGPMAIRFAADGRVFVAEKSGRIVAFDSVADPTPTVVLNLRPETSDYWDRGLLGFALDPAFVATGPAARPYLYVYYVYDAPPGQVAPYWNDRCPSPPTGPGPTLEGCVVNGKLARYTVDLATNVADPASRVELLSDWCAQFPSHSGGAMAFGPDGQLYLAGGDGASFTVADYGQRGGTVPDTTNPFTPINPCGDPLTVTSPPGASPTVDVASSEAGSLRSQDVRTTGDPTGLGGTLIRVDPDTGLASAGNPLGASADTNTRRIVATGFRNAFRLAVRPGTGELFIGDVGASHWEEVNRFVPVAGPATPTTIPNYGWPCYEGNAPADTWSTLGTALCTNLYAQGPSAIRPPLYAYDHTGTAAPCGAVGLTTASITGLAFYDASAADQTPFPARYDRALFIADYSRDCLAVLLPGTNGLPDPTRMEVVATGVANPVDLVTGPHGDLYYADLHGNRVMRIRYAPEPVAKATVSPPASLAPVTVTLDASTSLDPDPEASLVAWRWDLDHDGSFAGPADRTGETIDWPIAVPGVYPVTLQVESSNGLTDTVELRVDASDNPPVPRIDAPAADLHWSVGQAITFSGSATDAEDGAIPASGLSWTASLLHCGPSDCHEHVLQSFDGVAGGEITAPDHPYPSKLVLRLDATDSHGSATSITRELDPQPATLDVGSVPAGVEVAVGDGTLTTPGSVTLVRGGSTTLTAPAVWTAGTSRYRFLGWSDGGARSHDVTVTDPRALTATYGVDAPEACTAAGTIAKGTWVRDWASGGGDEDWFRFSLASSKRVTVTLGDLPVNARLELFRACGTLLATSDHGGTRFEQLSRSLAAGTYRLRVSVPSGASATTPYVVRVDAVGARVAVRSSTARRTSGSVRVVGEILNATGATTGRATIVAELRDAQGRLLRTLSGTSFASRLANGGVSPFVISGTGPAFASVTFRVTPGAPGASRTLVLRTLSTRANPNGTVTESGSVRNDDRRRAPSVAVARTWYGVRGEILDARWVPTSPASLGPGARGSFTILRPVLGTVQATRTQLRPS